MLITSHDIDIEIDRKKVCSYIGYSDDVEPSARIASILDEYIENAHHLIEPLYSCVIRDVERIQESRVYIDNSIIFDGYIVSRLLEQCQKVAMFVLTIGNRLEEMAAQLAEDGMIIESYILDAIGSVATENMAEYVQGMISEFAHLKQLTTSRRFSPGYCDWDINQQEMVFKAMDEDLPGVRLNEGGIMTPQKSIAGIIGIAPNHSSVYRYNPCKTCDKMDCVGRR